MRVQPALFVLFYPYSGVTPEIHFINCIAVLLRYLFFTFGSMNTKTAISHNFVRALSKNTILPDIFKYQCL